VVGTVPSSVDLRFSLSCGRRSSLGGEIYGVHSEMHGGFGKVTGESLIKPHILLVPLGHYILNSVRCLERGKWSRELHRT
jgi:hypothetical protein